MTRIRLEVSAKELAKRAKAPNPHYKNGLFARLVSSAREGAVLEKPE